MSQLPPPIVPNPFVAPSQEPDSNAPIPLIDTPAKRRGSPILVVISWVVVLLVGSIVFFSHYLSSGRELSEGEAKVELQQVNSMAKFAIATANWSGSDGSLASNLNSGPLEHRLCYVLIVSELEGPQTARESLQKLDELVGELNYDRDQTQDKLTFLIGDLLSDYEQGDWTASSLAVEDRRFLIDQLGFSAEMSLAPSEGTNLGEREDLISQAKRSAILLYVLMGMVLAGGGLGLFCFMGFAAMIAFSTLGGSNLVRPHFASDSLNGRIYGETFAVWITCFVGMGLAIGLVVVMTGIRISETGSAAIGVFAFFGSLIALAWPVIRGVPVREVREDLGLKTGNPIKEAALGVFAYLANLPLLFFGLMCATGLAALSESMQDKHELEATRQASHPIVEQIAQGDWLLIGLVILTACVAAPIVEEIVFRGLLYRHLRELSLKWGRGLSILFAIVVNSFVFAAIHPQGWTAIPVLMSLAVGFSWAREWRSSLVASMTMHALNNGMITMVMLSFLL